jgi:hypothetical protein
LLVGFQARRPARLRVDAAMLATAADARSQGWLASNRLPAGLPTGAGLKTSERDQPLPALDHPREVRSASELVARGSHRWMATPRPIVSTVVAEVLYAHLRWHARHDAS